jgi:hypothetical protein
MAHHCTDSSENNPQNNVPAADYRMLNAPTLDNNSAILGATTKLHRKQNKAQQKALQQHQPSSSLLQRIIHAFAFADPTAKIFMAKWDIKDGFWRLDCAEGEEWNFCYVLPPLHPYDPIQLVVPTLLQMGWIDSPPYFCAASETARDVAEQYLQLSLGSLKPHKFLPLTELLTGTNELPVNNGSGDFKSPLEVYMDDYIGLAIPTSRPQLNYFANAVMHGIHDVFPANSIDDNDPISLKKLHKGEGKWAIVKDILGITFDGSNKTVWLEKDKRDTLIDTLTK